MANQNWWQIGKKYDKQSKCLVYLLLFECFTGVLWSLDDQKPLQITTKWPYKRIVSVYTCLCIRLWSTSSKKLREPVCTKQGGHYLSLPWMVKHPRSNISAIIAGLIFLVSALTSRFPKYGRRCASRAQDCHLEWREGCNVVALAPLGGWCVADAWLARGWLLGCYVVALGRRRWVVADADGRCDCDRRFRRDCDCERGESRRESFPFGHLGLPVPKVSESLVNLWDVHRLSSQ